MASFLGRHGKEKSVLPAFVIVDPARAGQLPVNARGQIRARFGFRQTHGVIMPSSDNPWQGRFARRRRFNSVGSRFIWWPIDQTQRMLEPVQGQFPMSYFSWSNSVWRPTVQAVREKANSSQFHRKSSSL